MTVNFDDLTRNAMLDAIETQQGASPILRMRTGAKPANCAAADSGSVLAEMALPADHMAAAAGGVKVKNGTWEDLSADAAGTIGHYRIYTNPGGVCKEQGSVTITGGGGDMTVNNPVVEVGQAITVTSKSYTAGNA